MATRASSTNDPPPDGGADVDRAAATAEALLEAYYLQDERERCLLRGAVGQAADAAARALERMATAYVMEFPHVDSSRAQQAGEAFMRALFVQDEIENWDQLRRLPDADRRSVLLCDPSERYGSNPIEDSRWEIVRTHLREACCKAYIDERYAETQTRFWLFHGQSDERWEGVAYEAHGFKLQAMVDEPSESAVRRLGECFVDGVKIHDGWTHRDETKDLAEVIEMVTGYYEELFELRAGSR